MNDGKLELIIRFYELLSELETRLGGKRTLDWGNDGVRWPHRGVYFFFECGEERHDSGKGLRVVRVGTHAVSSGSKSTLWGRLSTHRGNLKTGGGNHRGSIFRLLVGEALANSQADLAMPSWGQGSSTSRVVRDTEIPLEIEVSRHLRQMPFLWLRAEDEPSASSVRGIIERNAIALLSNYGRNGAERIDGPSEHWLGRHSLHPRVRESGLWNNNHVDERCDPEFFSVLENLIRGTA